MSLHQLESGVMMQADVETPKLVRSASEMSTPETLTKHSPIACSPLNQSQRSSISRVSKNKETPIDAGTKLTEATFGVAQMVEPDDMHNSSSHTNGWQNPPEAVHSVNENLHGTWTAVIVNRAGSMSDHSKLKIDIELPWLDLITAKRSRGLLLNLGNQPSQGAHVQDRRPSNELYRIHSPIGNNARAPVKATYKSYTLPHHYRSTYYQLVDKKEGEVAQDKRDQKAPENVEGSTQQRYLEAMTDLDRISESNLDWRKFERLETTMWMAQTDPTCPGFIRQGSFTSYMRILRNAIKGRRTEAEKLKEEVGEYYSENAHRISVEQLQHLAHFRLLMDDTLRDILHVQTNLFQSAPTDAEIDVDSSGRKRFPLITPVRARERYAKQVRVVTEMLAMLKELYEQARNDNFDDSKKINLFPKE